MTFLEKIGSYAAKMSYIIRKTDHLYDIFPIISPKQSVQPSHSPSISVAAIVKPQPQFQFLSPAIPA